MKTLQLENIFSDSELVQAVVVEAPRVKVGAQRLGFGVGFEASGAEINLSKYTWMRAADLRISNLIVFREKVWFVTYRRTEKETTFLKLQRGCGTNQECPLEDAAIELKASREVFTKLMEPSLEGFEAV